MAKRYTVIFDEDQLNVMDKFLKRLDLKGIEAPIFVSIVTTMQNAKEYIEPKKKKVAIPVVVPKK